MNNSKGKWVLSTDVCLLSKPGATCSFCKEYNDSELLYGKSYKIGRLNCHHFCLLLSSKLLQNGKDNEGILGFLYEDIIKELKRTSKSKCYYCGWVTATLSCHYSDCKKVFHLPCGRRNGALNMFSDRFQSYCKDHRPMQRVSTSVFSDRTIGVDTLVIRLQRVDDKSAKTIQNIRDPSPSTLIKHNGQNDSETVYTCAICYDDVVPYPTEQSIWPECCRKDKWLHRICVARLALSAGRYHVRCPLCNNQALFLSMLHSYGFYVPDQDASWELENGAFQELLERPTECFRKDCLCPRGSSFSSTGNGPWKLIICGLCGSQALHKACDESKGRKGVVCNRCLPSSSRQTSDWPNSEISSVAEMNTELISDTPESESENESEFVGRRLPLRSGGDLTQGNNKCSDVEGSVCSDVNVMETSPTDQYDSSFDMEERKLEIISSLSKMLKSDSDDNASTSETSSVECILVEDTASPMEKMLDDTQTHALISQLSNTIRVFNERNRTESIDSGLDLSNVISKSVVDVSNINNVSDETVLNNGPTEGKELHSTSKGTSIKEVKSRKKSNKSRTRNGLGNHKVKIISKRLNKRHPCSKGRQEIKKKRKVEKKKICPVKDINTGKLIKVINVEEYFNNLEKMEKKKVNKDESSLVKSNNLSEFNNDVVCTNISMMKDKSKEKKHTTKKHWTQSDITTSDKLKNTQRENRDQRKKHESCKEPKKLKLNEKNLREIDGSVEDKVESSEGNKFIKFKYEDPKQVETKRKNIVTKKSSPITWTAGKPRNGVNVVLKNGKFCILNKDGKKVKVKELIEKGPKHHKETERQTEKCTIKRTIKKSKSKERKDKPLEESVDSTKISIKVTSLVKHPKNKLAPEKGQKDILSFFKKVFDTFEDVVRKTDMSGEVKMQNSTNSQKLSGGKHRYHEKHTFGKRTNGSNELKSKCSKINKREKLKKNRKTVFDKECESVECGDNIVITGDVRKENSEMEYEVNTEDYVKCESNAKHKYRHENVVHSGAKDGVVELVKSENRQQDSVNKVNSPQAQSSVGTKKQTKSSKQIKTSLNTTGDGIDARFVTHGSQDPIDTNNKSGDKSTRSRKQDDERKRNVCNRNTSNVRRQVRRKRRHSENIKHESCKRKKNHDGASGILTERQSRELCNVESSGELRVNKQDTCTTTRTHTV